MRWPAKTAALAEARISRGFYTCACCKQAVPTTTLEKGKKVRNVEVNHKVPVSIPGAWDSWDGFIERLFCDKAGLEVLCKDCHKLHTENLKTLKEEWREVKNFPQYEVSSFGRVRHRENGFLSPYKDTHYLFVNLYSKELRKAIKCSVHRLVAEHFLDNPYDLLEVNHKDCYKLNNYVFNLEWCTRSQNASHASDNNLYASGVAHHNFKGYWVTPYGKFTSVKDAANKDSVSYSTVFRRCNDPENREYYFEKKDKNNDEF